MKIPEQVYSGMPRGLSSTAALVILAINVFAPGVGTIISAFLGTECMNETVFVGILQLLTSPLLGLGFFWAIAWSIRLYRKHSTADETPTSATDEETPLVGEAAVQQAS
ncbi:hypothetical protein BWQ96_00023 [Gracilariopsis chorda]|uniref:Uncharacterized protein n=1 Tax=Gracilariopsis chorda TaxID=448386 RepID=A0A2V3J6C4_9FLOR|nr:hypothetical protein BWQ96_00023 [Gracilariopsis chorda]|eukprot:PXF49863.1 hypothetical protein BWQ96_00023 [Gracilariopsis chorda]